MKFRRELLELAKAVTEVEQRLGQLCLALAHEDVHVQIDGRRRSGSAAIEEVCHAYSTIDYAMEDEPNQSVVCVGVVGVKRTVVKLAGKVNDAKTALREVCAPLQKARVRVPVAKSYGQSKAIPLTRLLLRHMQRSELNLLAAYRKIPILERPPRLVSFTRAFTRAVYRVSVVDIRQMLHGGEGPQALEDLARLSALPRGEDKLALVREHYENIRANVALRTLDKAGRGRIQLSAELPILYPKGRSQDRPEVSFPSASQPSKRRTRASQLADAPYLQTLPVYRYAREAMDSRSRLGRSRIANTKI